MMQMVGNIWEKRNLYLIFCPPPPLFKNVPAPLNTLVVDFIILRGSDKNQIVISKIWTTKVNWWE